MMARTKRTLRQENRFLEVLAETGNVSQACQLAALPRQSAYDLRKRHPDFQEAWDRACEMGEDALVDEATRRAVDGIEHPVFRKGEVVGYTTKYSDKLLMFLLKGRRPDMFREHSTPQLADHQQVSGNSGAKREQSVAATVQAVGHGGDQ